MNESQKMLLARVMLQLNQAFENMTLPEQAEVAQSLNQRLERQILGAHRLAEFNSAIHKMQREADLSEAQYKQRKAAYEKEVAATEAAKSESTPIPVQSTAEQDAVAPTETTPDSEPTTDA